MGGRRKGKDPNHGNSTMVKMRRFMVQTKKQELVKYKELDPIVLNNLWNLCQISFTQLSCPVVACEMGRFYQKEAVIELLIDRNKLEGKFAPEIHENCLHIRNMKDVTELRLTLNPNYRKDAKPVVMLNGSTTAAGAVDGTTVVNSSQYHCPFTGLEMSGRYRFVFFLTCGCVVSERAAKNISTSICPVCSKPYHPRDDLIVLNQIAKEKLQLMKDIMEEKRQKRHDDKRDRKLREKLHIPEDERIPPADKISEWLQHSADRRRSSTSSSDIDQLRRCSTISSTSAHSTQSAEQIPAKEARKRRLEAWAKEERRKSDADADKAEKLRLLKAQILSKKMKLLKEQEDESSTDSDSSDTESD
jgi:hypothetical protein